MGLIVLAPAALAQTADDDQAPDEAPALAQAPAASQPAAPAPLRLNDEANGDAADATRVPVLGVSRLSLPRDWAEEEVLEARERDYVYRGVSVMMRKRPDYDPAGFRLGSFTLFPQLSARAGYDSNVFSQDDEKRDVVGTARATAELKSNWGRHALNLLGWVDERAYGKYTTESGITYRLRGDGRLDIGRDGNLTAKVGHERVFVRRGNTGELITTRRPARYWLTDGELVYQQMFGRLRTTLGGYAGRYDYQNAQTPGGAPLDLQYRDYALYRGMAEIGYASPAGPVLFVSAMGELRRFRVASAPILRDSDSYELLGGVQGAVTPLIRGRAAFGYLRADFKDPGVRSRGIFSFDVDLDYLVTELTTVRASGRRYYQNIAAATSPAGLNTDLRLGADHELLRNLILSASASYRATRYVELGTRAHSVGVDGGARWLLNRNLRATLDLGYRQRSGSAVDVSRAYDDFEGGIGLVYAF
jgi:hypothetical protein